MKPRTHLDWQNEVRATMGLGPLVAETKQPTNLKKENEKLKREIGRAKAREAAATQLYNNTVTNKTK